MLRFTKKLLKNNEFIKHTIAFLIYTYLKFVYLTTRWSYIFPNKQTETCWQNASKVVAVTWHNKLAILPYSIIHKNSKFHILASPHSDGIIISLILKRLKFNIIAGSTNKNSVIAVKNIMQVLQAGENVAITPDGPRGPKYEINSNIIDIAKKCNALIMPVSCKTTHYFCLNSWDQLIIPLPFGKIEVYVESPLSPAIEEITKDRLKSALDDLELK